LGRAAGARRAIGVEEVVMVDRMLFNPTWVFVGVGTLLAVLVAVIIPYLARRRTRR
jgi:hypothetical protein